VKFILALIMTLQNRETRGLSACLLLAVVGSGCHSSAEPATGEQAGPTPPAANVTDSPQATPAVQAQAALATEDPAPSLSPPDGPTEDGLHDDHHARAVSSVRAELIDLLWDDARALNEIGWEIATEGNGSDLDLALKAARRAADLTGHQNAMILDTVARVYFEQGDLDQALAWQRSAVANDQDGNPDIDAALRRYLEVRAAARQNAARDDSGDRAASSAHEITSP
jgi:tetratricopeptide (TPR) repeat protein